MKNNVPAFDLYGEFLTGNLTEPLHYEAIKDRSSRHDWDIKLHIHRRLAQIFILKTVGVSIQLGHDHFVSTEPLILLIPPNIPHGFHFSETVVGDVITLQLKEFNQNDIDRIEAMTKGQAVMLAQSDTTHFSEITAIVDQIKNTYGNFSHERVEMLRALCRITLLYIADEVDRRPSLATPANKVAMSSQERYADQFCAAVEEHYTSSKNIEDYAEIVGISAPHLNRTCRSLLGFTPNQLVRRRRMLEAKRLLRYTRLTAAEIAVKTGFEDAPYFNRVFKADTNKTPMEFRKAHDAE